MDIESTSSSESVAPHAGAGTERLFNRWTLLSAALLFLVSIALTTRNNGFPFTYHPDESSKVKQVLGNKRNFNHPLLLLTGTDALRWLRPSARSRQEVVVIGRTFTALCAAGVVAAFTLLAASRHGLAAGWIAGILTTLHPQLFELAHYMKEDPPLMFGLALTFLAMELFRRRASDGVLIFLGIASATAVSGKYLGVLAPLMAVPLVLLSVSEKSARRHRLKLLSLAFTGTFLLINYSAFLHPAGMFDGIMRGSQQAATGHTGLTRQVPHLAYWPVLRMEIAAPIAAFAAFHLASLLARWRAVRATEWLIGLFPVAYFLMLSFSPEVSPRYLLPVTTSACLLAAFGAVECAGFLARILPDRAQWSTSHFLAVGALALMLRSETPLFSTLYRAYSSDDRIELETWVRDYIPAGAVIAQDGRVGLPRPDDVKNGGGRAMPQNIRTGDFVADLGTLAELRAGGVAYVGVCFTTYGRFFDPAQTPSPGARAQYELRKAFYQTLFAEGERVWTSSPGRVLYLHPGLDLFKIERNPITPGNNAP